MSGLTEIELKQQIDELLDIRDALSQKLRAAQHEAESLAATVEALRGALTWAHSQAVDTVMIGETYKIYTVWEIADIEFVSKILSAAPQQHLRDVRAEAGLDGFIAGCEWFINLCPKNRRGMTVMEAATQYAESVKSGEV